MRIKPIAVLSSLIFGLLSIQVSQPATGTPKANTAWFYVEIETKVYRKGVEISNANPSERRWYISTVTVLPDDVPTYSLVKLKIVP